MSLLDIIIFITRLLIGSILIIAGFLKLQIGSRRFLQNILAFGFVKGHVAQFISNSLPWLEVGCGLFMLVGLFMPMTSLVSFGLLLIFTVAIAFAVVQEKQVGCDCFGKLSEKNQVRWHLAYRNLVLMGLIILIFSFGPGWLALDNWVKQWPNHLFESVIKDVLVFIWLSTLLLVLV